DLAHHLTSELVSEGRINEADALLREVCTRYSGPLEDWASDAVLRGALRWDFSLHREAAPFFQSTLRNHLLSMAGIEFSIPGAEWAAGFHPETPIVDSPREVQAALDNIRRQLAAGSVEDTERALHNLSGILKAAPSALIPV